MKSIVVSLGLLLIPISSQGHFFSSGGSASVIVGDVFELHVLPAGPSDDCIVEATMASSDPTVVSGGGSLTENSPTFTFTAHKVGAVIINQAFDGVGDECPAVKTETLLVTVTDPVGLSSSNQVSSGTDADPVNTFTGELFQQLTPDLNLGGPMPLLFERYYASYLRRSFVLGDLGSNWRHNFDAVLAWNGTNLRFISNKGRVTKFVLDTNTQIWMQLDNTDTPYQVSINTGQDAILWDPETELIYTFDYTTANVIAGNLKKVEDGKGNVHTITYDTNNGHIANISDGLGRTLSFTYNTDAIPKIQTISDGSRSVSYQYTDPVDDEYLTIFGNVSGGFSVYAYEDTSTVADHALMTSHQLPRLNTPYIQTFYDTSNQFSSGKVATQTDALGNTVNFTYSNLTTTVSDALVNNRVHTHTVLGELANYQDESAMSIGITADGDSRRSGFVDRKGNSTGVTYHTPSGKVASINHADGTTTSFSYSPRSVSGITIYDRVGKTYPDGSSASWFYDANGRITSYMNRAGLIWSYTYNDKAQMLTATNPSGGVITQTYHGDRTLATRVDASANTTSFSYDSKRRLVTILNPDNTTRQFTYDLRNNRLTETDERSNTRTYTYDANDNLKTMTDALTNVTMVSYDAMDRISSDTNPLGKTVNRTYDERGKLKTLKGPDGDVTTFSYDPRGRLASIKDSSEQVWSQTFDGENTIASITDPLSNITAFGSDAMGRITQVTSAAGNTTDINRDMAGRVTSTSNPLGELSSLDRDVRGQLSGVTLSGATVSSAYDRNAFNQITMLTDPNGNDWVRAFDKAGRLTSTADPLGNTTTFSYDNRNRLEGVSYPETLGTLTLTYDGTSNITQMAYSDGTTHTFAYDNINRLTAATGVNLGYDAASNLVNSDGLHITRESNNRIKTLKYADGKSLTYNYNSLGQLVNLSDWTGATTSFSYDQAGRMLTTSRPNGVVTAYTYDDDSNLVALGESKTGPLSSIQLQRDGVGQIISATREVPEAASIPADNSMSFGFNSGSQIGTSTYDAAGKLTSGSGRTHAWNLASQMMSYSESSATSSFTYDALGNRLSRTANGDTRQYIWNHALSLKVVSVLKENGSDFRYYIYTPRGLLLYSLEAADNLRRDYHFDEMGNTIFLTDNSGSITDSYAYSPFGRLLGKTGSSDNNYTWQGQFGVQQEGSSGLYYMRSRYYDSQTTKFLSHDPRDLITPSEINPYQYASLNPLRFNDPTGQEPQVPGGSTDSGTTRPPNFTTYRRVNFCGHMWIVVGIYNDKGDKVGERSLHFSPMDNGNWTTNLPRQDVYWDGIHYYIKSSRDADKKLLELWKYLQKNGPGWNPSYNCIVASFQFSTYGIDESPVPEPEEDTMLVGVDIQPAPDSSPSGQRESARRLNLAWNNARTIGEHADVLGQLGGSIIRDSSDQFLTFFGLNGDDD